MPGTVVSHAPADAATADDAVTWEGSDQQYDPLGVRSHVVFAPNSGVISSAATAFGIGVDVAHLKAQDLIAVAFRWYYSLGSLHSCGGSDTGWPHSHGRGYSR